MPWCFIKFSQLILKGYVWRSVWKICMWILGLKGLNHLHLNYRSPLSGPTSLRRSTTCENISLNGQGQICLLICAGERDLSNHTRMSMIQSRRPKNEKRKSEDCIVTLKPKKGEKRSEICLKSLKHPCTSLSLGNVEMWLERYVATTTLKKGGGETKRKRDFLKCFKVFVWDCSY